MSNVGIIVVTKDRPNFVERLLDYYSRVGSPHALYIGDGTEDATSKEIILRAIDKAKDILKINYYETGKLSAGGTHEWLTDKIEEDYCCYAADDDLLVPKSLSKCAQFLDENRNYSSAQGSGIIFEIHGDKPFGKVTNTSRYWNQPEATALTPKERLFTFVDNYWCPQFSVKRTQEYVESFSSLDPELETYWYEIIHQILLIINGRSKFIDCLYLCRQNHAARYSIEKFHGPIHLLGWITRENWLVSYKLYEKIFAAAVRSSLHLNKEESENFAREIFFRYLSNQFSEAGALYRKQSTPTLAEKGKYIITKNSDSSELIDVISSAKRRLLHQTPKLSLRALLRESSPYFDDFRTVYECLTR